MVVHNIHDFYLTMSHQNKIKIIDYDLKFT